MTNTKKIIQDLSQELNGKIRINVNLNKLCWFQTGGPAEILFQPHDIYDLQKLIIYNKNNYQLPINIFGVGSNVLISDQGINGIVIRLGRAFNYINLIKENDDIDPIGKNYSNKNYSNDNTSSKQPLAIQAGASALDLHVSQFAAENRIGGFEFYSGIPGTIGGAIAMNAGAYGRDTSQCVKSVQAINRLTGEIKRFSNTEIGFVYRGNSINKEWIFLEAICEGYIDDIKTIKMKMDDIRQSRESSQPIRSRTGGSTFRNPPGNSAWKLIDEAGCRGLKIGGAQVSEMHCNFLINNGNATSQDIERIIQTIEQKVQQITGIKLHREIILMGYHSDLHNISDHLPFHDIIIKKLIYRSKHRGSKEADIILSQIIPYIKYFNTEQIKEYEKLIELSDVELYHNINKPEILSKFIPQNH